MVKDITNKEKKENYFQKKKLKKKNFLKQTDKVNKLSTHFANIGKQPC